MKVYVVSYYVEPGEAGVNSIWKNKKDAEKRFEACVRDAWAVNIDLKDITPADLRAKVKKALKEGFHEYPGDGCGPNPWYGLTEETLL
jgi:hypothetical protein